jgi:uncharacterized membrane protein YozB (DUF420 family)
MDLRTAPGFLGTAASRASDLSLLAYIFLIVPSMLIGFRYARRQNFAMHQLVMTGIVIFNWILIAYLMVASYMGGVAPKLPDGLNQPAYLLPSVHLVTGLTAQIIGTILAAQMWLGPIMPFRLEPIKNWMRLTLTLWLVTATLGFATYVTWYGVPFSSRRGANPLSTPGPVATEDVVPVATEDVVPPAASEVGDDKGGMGDGKGGMGSN